MTLISLIDGYGQPVIISDRAISDTVKLHLVKSPITNAAPKTETPVVDFMLKTIIIKEILCIGLAGNVGAIQTLVRDIKDWFLHRNVNSQTVCALIDEIKLVDPGCSFLMALGGEEYDSGKLQVAICGDYVFDKELQHFSLYSIGSGAKTWTQRIKDKVRYFDMGVSNPIFGRQRALISAMIFHHEEYGSDANLLDGWGAGFDLVYYHDNRFYRYDNVAYIVWQVDISDLRTLHEISMVHTCYHEDYVVIRSLSFGSKEVHVVPGIGCNAAKYRPTLNCESNDIVTMVRVFNNELLLENIGIAFYNPSPRYGTSFAVKETKNGDYVYTLDDVYRKFVLKGVKQMLDL